MSLKIRLAAPRKPVEAPNAAPADAHAPRTNAAPLVKVKPIVLSVPRAAEPERTGPEQHTFEEHLVLRLPDDVSWALAPDVASGALDYRRLQIDWESPRVARVTVRMSDEPVGDGGASDDHGAIHDESTETLLGVLLDMPTIVETYRACDGGAQHVKVADIGQIIVCSRVPGCRVVTGGARLSDVPAARQIIGTFEAAKWQSPDGLTPPMARCVSRRFARSAIPSLSSREPGGTPPEGVSRADAAAILPPSSLAMLEDVERTVAAMIRRDDAAARVSFEIQDSTTSRPLYRGGTGVRFLRRVGADGEDAGDEEEEDAESFAETSTQAGESDGHGTPAEESDDEGFAAELEEEMLADDSTPGPVPGSGSTGDASVDVPQGPAEPQRPSGHADDLRAKIAERRAQLASVSNPLIRARLEDAIRQLESDLSRRAQP